MSVLAAGHRARCHAARPPASTIRPPTLRYRRPVEDFGSDGLADQLGLAFEGIARGAVTRFAGHPVTEGVTSLDYPAAGAAIVAPEKNPAIQVLGWLSPNSFLDLNDDGRPDPGEPYGAAAMGVLWGRTARITFLGEINGIEQLPQPLTDNLVTWSFGCGFSGAMKRP
jgi:hypothetical protein